MPTTEQFDACPKCGSEFEVLHETEAANKGDAYHDLKQYDDW